LISVLDGEKLHADWNWRFDRFADGGQFSGRAVNPEDDERIGILVGGDQELAGRINIEVAGDFSLGGFVPNPRDAAGRGVNREDGDRVMPAVGTVDEPTVGMNADASVPVLSSS
jgi:hypothetical protein